MGNKNRTKDSMPYVEKQEAIEKAIRRGKREKIDSVGDAYALVAMIATVIGLVLAVVQTAQIALMGTGNDMDVLQKIVMTEKSVLFYIGVITILCSMKVKKTDKRKNICMGFGAFFVCNIVWVIILSMIMAKIRATFGA